MPRVARVVAAGAPHHITQRGTNRQVVFQDNEDSRVFLRGLEKQAEKRDVRFAAYCLMPNHFHIIAFAERAKDLAMTLSVATAGYSRYFHVRHGGSGHLWEQRYYSCAMDLDHFYHALAYVENNPVRAGLVQDPELWHWSSARAHLQDRPAAISLDNTLWRQEYDSRRWAMALAGSVRDEGLLERMREATRSGFPLADQALVLEWEILMGRRLHPGKAGRPSKKPAQGEQMRLFRFQAAQSG